MGKRYQGNDRVTLGTTFFTTGTASATQAFIAINHPSTSRGVVVVASLRGALYEISNALGRQLNTIKASTLATGGVPITQVPKRTSEPPAAVPVVVLGAMSGDGTGAAAITKGTAIARIKSSVSPNGFQAFTSVAAGATQNWDLIEPEFPPELAPGESLHVMGDVAASGFLAISFVLIQTR